MQNLFSEAWEKPRGPSIGLLSVSSKHWTQTRLTAENKCLTLHFFSCHSTGSALEMLSSRKMVQWPFQICSDKAQRHQLGEDWAEEKCPHLPLTAQSASLHLPPPRALQIQPKAWMWHSRLVWNGSSPPGRVLLPYLRVFVSISPKGVGGGGVVLMLSTRQVTIHAGALAQRPPPPRSPPDFLPFPHLLALCHLLPH